MRVFKGWKIKTEYTFLRSMISVIPNVCKETGFLASLEMTRVGGKDFKGMDSGMTKDIALRRAQGGRHSGVTYPAMQWRDTLRNDKPQTSSGLDYLPRS